MSYIEHTNPLYLREGYSYNQTRSGTCLFVRLAFLWSNFWKCILLLDIGTIEIRAQLSVKARSVGDEFQERAMQFKRQFNKREFLSNQLTITRPEYCLWRPKKYQRLGIALNSIFARIPQPSRLRSAMTTRNTNFSQHKYKNRSTTTMFVHLFVVAFPQFHDLGTFCLPLASLTRSDPYHLSIAL